MLIKHNIIVLNAFRGMKVAHLSTALFFFDVVFYRCLAHIKQPNYVNGLRE